MIYALLCVCVCVCVSQSCEEQRAWMYEAYLRKDRCVVHLALAVCDLLLCC